jgi:hypothetical protein
VIKQTMPVRWSGPIDRYRSRPLTDTLGFVQQPAVTVVTSRAARAPDASRQQRDRVPPLRQID